MAEGEAAMEVCVVSCWNGRSAFENGLGRGPNNKEGRKGFATSL